MGLFDPPIVGIRKRLPIGHEYRLDEVISRLRETMPEYLSSTERGLIEGYVGSVWVGNEVENDRLPIEDKKLLYVMNMGNNCVRLLRENMVLAAHLAIAVMPELGDTSH